MDAKQRQIDWDLVSLETQLRNVLDEDSDVSLVLSLAVENREAAAADRRPFGADTVFTKTKAELALAAKSRSRNTGVAALRRLAARGVLAYEISARGHLILVDWTAVWELAPDEGRRDRLRQRLEAGREAGEQALVRGGQGWSGPGARVQEKEIKPRVTTETVSSVSRGGDERLVRPRSDQGDALPEDAPAGIRQRLRRPWMRSGGLVDADLLWAVARRDRTVLLALYTAGLDRRFWEDCSAYRQRFLSCCWQAAESFEKSAMGLLNRLVKDNLTDDHEPGWRSTLSEESDMWATETRRQWNTPPEYAEARAARRNLGLVGCEELP